MKWDVGRKRLKTMIGLARRKRLNGGGTLRQLLLRALKMLFGFVGELLTWLVKWLWMFRMSEGIHMKVE
jgi:hypothetical protein